MIASEKRVMDSSSYDFAFKLQLEELASYEIITQELTKALTTQSPAEKDALLPAPKTSKKDSHVPLKRVLEAGVAENDLARALRLQLAKESNVPKVKAVIGDLLQQALLLPRESTLSESTDSENGYHPAMEALGESPDSENVYHSARDVFDESKDAENAYQLALQDFEEFFNSSTRDPGKFAAECSSASDWRKRRDDEQDQQHQLDKAMAEIYSEIAARENQQVWHDEILARRLESDPSATNSTSDHSAPSTTASHYDSQVYNLFYAEARDEQGHVGVGSVTKDTEGHIRLENRACLGSDMSQHFGEYTALIKGIDYARSAGVGHIVAHGNCPFIYYQVNGLVEVWKSEQLHLLQTLQKEIKQLDSFSLVCIPKVENLEAINLANHAIEKHVSDLKKRPSRQQSVLRIAMDDMRKDCLICLDKTFESDVVQQRGCDHEFCFSCLSQHVENEIQDGRIPIRCPQFMECSVPMELHDCQLLGLVSPKSFDSYSLRLAEATISDCEKVYCPFPNCSALMYVSTDTKGAASSISRRSSVGSAECMECHRLFCAECKVPWHGGLSCVEYQRLPPDERDAEDIKLFRLAKNEKWRRCKKCRSMIIRSQGCFHMTCRCGYEFCYTCETGYQKKMKMCKCPLFQTV